MRLRIMNYAYYNIIENEYDPSLVGPVLVICGRDPHGKFHRLKVTDKLFRPHMYVEDTQENRLKLEALDADWNEFPFPAVYDEEEKVLVVYANFPYEIKWLRKNFDHTYEADIKWEKMAMSKLGLDAGFIEVTDDKEWITADDIKPVKEEDEFMVDPRVFYFDIETDWVNEDKAFELDNQLIISIVVYDNYINQYDILEWGENSEYWTEEKNLENHMTHLLPQSKCVFHHCDSEKELLIKFFHLFKRRPDAIMDFNGHGGNELVTIKSTTQRKWRNGFDEPVIYKRAMANHLEDEMQWMSPLPRIRNKFGAYYGVYARGQGDKFEVVIRGVTPLDFYFDEPKMGYTLKDREKDFFGRSLDAYLKYYAHDKKVEHEGLTVAELKRVDPYKELMYNKKDVEGLVFLDKHFGYAKDIFDTVSLTLVEGIDVNYATKIHAFLILKESADNCVYDTKYQNWSRNIWGGWLDKKYGGFNVDMSKGAKGWTMVMDFSRLYPTLLISSNAGIDTLVSVKEEFDDYYVDFKDRKWYKKDLAITPSAPFRKDKESINIKIWKKIIGYRNALKAKMAEILEKNGGDVEDPEYKLTRDKEYNLKQRVVNNKFGATGNRGFLDWSRAVYNVAPSMSHPLIKGLANEFLPSIGSKARGGDTDSVFVELGDCKDINDAVKKSNDIVDKANKYIKSLMKEIYNIESDIVILDWEKIGPFFYGHKKKNYALEVWAQDGKILPEDKRYMMYKGFQLKKRDRADITQTVQKIYIDVAKKCLKENKNFIKEITKVAKRMDEIFPYLKWTDICSRVNIKKKLSDYADNFENRRAAEFSNERFNTNFTIGSSAFKGYVDLNGGRRLKPVMLFKKENIPKIKKLGYKLKYNLHKQKFLIDKLDLLLEDYDTTFNKLIKPKPSSVNVW